MKPVKTPHTPITLGAPESWDAELHGPCEGLPVMISNDIFYSWWKPTISERLAILFGRNIRLAVTGIVHPPVAMDVQS